MGAGLPFICGYDEELYKPTTFYIEDNDFEDVQDFVDTLNEDFDNYTDSDERVECLVRGFREYGIIASEGLHAKIVVSTESDNSLFVVAIIPNDITDVLETEDYIPNQYRNVDIEDLSSEDEKKIYQNYIDKFFKPEEEKFFKFMKETYHDCNKHVGSPWCPGRAFPD